MVDTSAPLWLRFVRLLRREARPSVREAIVTGLVLFFGLVYKISGGQLTTSLSLKNVLEAQFPLVAAAMVFFTIHAIKAARTLYQEVDSEQGEVEVDAYPSLILPERITRKQRKETPYFRVKIISFALISVVIFCVVGVLSWKANALVFGFGHQRLESSLPTGPTPEPTTSPHNSVLTSHGTPSPTPSLSPSPSPSPIASPTPFSTPSLTPTPSPIDPETARKLLLIQRKTQLKGRAVTLAGLIGHFLRRRHRGTNQTLSEPGALERRDEYSKETVRLYHLQFVKPVEDVLAEFRSLGLDTSHIQPEKATSEVMIFRVSNDLANLSAQLDVR